MRFKIDENLPLLAAQLLRESGHDAITVLDQQMGGTADSSLAKVIQQEKRALLTLDLDFSDIRTYPPEEYHGIIILRLQRQDLNALASLMRKLIPLIDDEVLTGHLWIIDKDKLRVRGKD